MSSDDNDDGENLNETKRYYESQEEGTGEPGSKPSSPKTVNTGPAAVPESAGNPTGSRPDAPSGNTPPTKPGATKGKGPSTESSGKAPASKLQLLAAALGVQECGSPLFLMRPPWHRLKVRKRIPSTAWKTIPVCSLDCKNWWSPWQAAMRWLRKTSDPGSLHPGHGDTAGPYFCCWGFPSSCQLDSKIPTCHEPRGESVDTWPTGPLGSGPGSWNCPIPSHNNPDHRARAKHSVSRDIPDPLTGLLPTCSGPDRGYLLRSECHPSLFAVQVCGSGPGWADNGLYLHLPV